MLARVQSQKYTAHSVMDKKLAPHVAYLRDVPAAPSACTGAGPAVILLLRTPPAHHLALRLIPHSLGMRVFLYHVCYAQSFFAPPTSHCAPGPMYPHAHRCPHTASPRIFRPVFTIFIFGYNIFIITIVFVFTQFRDSLPVCTAA